MKERGRECCCPRAPGGGPRGEKIAYRWIATAIRTEELANSRTADRAQFSCRAYPALTQRAEEIRCLPDHPRKLLIL